MASKEKFLEKQKKSLENEKQKLEKKIAELKDFPDYGHSDDDNAREVSDFESNLSIENQLKDLLKKVNSALKSIESGKYGRCKICREEIESGRLESMPYADICVKCGKK